MQAGQGDRGGPVGVSDEFAMIAFYVMGAAVIIGWVLVKVLS